MVDWIHVKNNLVYGGGLYEYLKTIPKENWNDIEPGHQYTLLIHACRKQKNNDAIKALILNGANVNFKNQYGETPLVCCVGDNNFIGVKMLYKSGADIYAPAYNLTLLEYCSVGKSENTIEEIYIIIKFFIAHGYRLKNVKPGFSLLTQEITHFESGVLKCRRATIAMLHSKRKLKLAKWDKFMLAEMANYIWATRDDTKWQ